MAGFVSEYMTLFGAYQSTDTRFRILVLISTIGIVLTAAYLLWAMQRVFLGKMNEKYKDFPDISFREVFSQAPLLFLCLALGVFPFFLLDWMSVSVRGLIGTLGGLLQG
jgi:NADH-quinone oxidoreductase subunit M